MIDKNKLIKILEDVASEVTISWQDNEITSGMQEEFDSCLSTAIKKAELTEEEHDEILSLHDDYGEFVLLSYSIDKESFLEDQHHD